jgi:hypothetical protein
MIVSAGSQVLSRTSTCRDQWTNTTTGDSDLAEQLASLAIATEPFDYRRLTCLIRVRLHLNLAPHSPKCRRGGAGF